MNFHSPMSRWSSDEVAILFSMRADKCPYPEIAKKLGRSLASVKVRAVMVGAVQRRKRRVRRTAEQPTVCILKADLPVLYAQGWRVVGFSGDAVQLEWRHNSHSPPVVRTTSRHPLIDEDA